MAKKHDEKHLSPPADALCPFFVQKGAVAQSVIEPSSGLQSAQRRGEGADTLEAPVYQASDLENRLVSREDVSYIRSHHPPNNRNPYHAQRQ
jgi:hypothetical protein